jgi:hypothetical protein
MKKSNPGIQTLAKKTGIPEDLLAAYLSQDNRSSYLQKELKRGI